MQVLQGMTQKAREVLLGKPMFKHAFLPHPGCPFIGKVYFVLASFALLNDTNFSSQNLPVY